MSNIPTFIGQYDDVLSQEDCDILIDEFEKHPNKIEGYVWTEEGTSYHPERKKAKELHRQSLTDDNTINKIVLKGLNPCMKLYDEEFEQLQYNGNWGIDRWFNFQKYEDETDGFKIWHCEHGLGNSSYRILAWMIYLNDAISGTEFKMYPTVEAKRGRCLIWPAQFTHTHRSEIPNQGIKYLVTGWVSLMP